MNSLKTRSNGNTTSQKLRPVSIDQKQRLKGLLREHQKMMREMLLESNPNLFYTNVDNVTCFTNQLIEDAVYRCDSLFSVEDILEKLSGVESGSCPQNLQLFMQSISISCKAIIVSYSQEHVTLLFL